jgi:hypothetical protein
MTSNSTSCALTLLVCGVVTCTSLACAQFRQTAPQVPSQFPQAQSDRTPRSEAAMPGELARGTLQALITPDELERRQAAGAPLRMSVEQIEGTKDRQSAPGE